jgi:hypothetical protein
MSNLQPRALPGAVADLVFRYGNEAMMHATKGPGITPRKMMSAASAHSEARWKKSTEGTSRTGIGLALSSG